MSIEVICTHYGRPATEALGKKIAAFKNGNPLAPVTVVVPTNIAGLSVRRALGARGRGIAAVNFLKLFDLAERLVGDTMTRELKRQPLFGPVLGATVRSVLNTAPGLFQSSAHHPATEQALARAYRDLRELSDEQLDVLAEQSHRAGDVVRICREVHARLKEQRYDGQDLNALAVQRLESQAVGGLLRELGPVIVHMPQRVTPSQGLFLTTLAKTTPVAVLVGQTGDDRADSGAQRSVALLKPGFDARLDATPPHGHKIISTTSADEEMRVAVREVVKAARDGIPLGRVAVLCGGGMASIRQLHAHLDAAEIPYSGPSGRTLANSLVGQGLQALLNLESRDFRRDDVFALLSVTSAPAPRAGDSDSEGLLATNLVMAWERISRQAGVARGAEQWESRLMRFASEHRAAANQQEQDPDGDEGRADLYRRNADHAESLAQFTAKLIHDLSPDPQPATWNDWCQWVRHLIDEYLGDEAARQDWPEPEQEAAKRIQETLNRLAELGEIERSPRPSDFRPTLLAELATASRRVGKVGRGVFTGLIGESLGMEFSRTIITGMAEGVFPHSPADDPLLPDRERKAVGGALSQLSDRMDDQHRHLLAALASSANTTLVYARGNERRASEHYPSRWLLDTATALAGSAVDSADLEELAGNGAADWLEHVPSHFGRVVHADVPATAQEFRMQALIRGYPLDSPQLDADPVLTRGAELVEARASDEFTRFDGNLAEADTTGLARGVVSPTSLERWAICPMSYFFQYVLRVQTFEQPEELLEISALEKGTLVHEALDRFMREQIEANRVPPPDEPWSPDQRARLQEIGEELCDQAAAKGLTGMQVYWHHDRRRILGDLNQFLLEDDKQRRDSGVTPIASEMAFGMPDADLPEVAVELLGGGQVRFRGQADRVDRGADNNLQATDYKTGKADPFGSLDESSKNWDPVLNGTKLQLPVYGLAARAFAGEPDAPVRSQYWFVTSQEEFKTVGYELDDRAIARFENVVGIIVRNIELGVFCDRPESGDTGRYSQRCDFCNADRLGTQNSRLAWERMCEAEDLESYRDLVELSEEDELDDEWFDDE